MIRTSSRKLQSLLAILADIDVAHGSNLIVIESRQMDDARKDQLIADLCADPSSSGARPIFGKSRRSGSGRKPRLVEAVP